MTFASHSSANRPNASLPRTWGNRMGISALGLVLVAGLALSARPSLVKADGTATTSSEAKQAASMAKSMSAAFRNAAGVIGKSVVSIRVEKKSAATPASFQGGQEMPQLPPGFEKFFGGQGQDPSARPGMPGQKSPRREPMMMGQGSGLITSADGNIVTNAHVVDGADNIIVVLEDGTEHTAKLLGIDKDADLAVVKIEATGLTAAKFANSDETQQGDWCVAVGNPYGLDHTVTAGIVSAKSRSNVGPTSFEDFIQTDTPINPGNSGGPLVNLDGEVIGINAAIRTSSGGSEGIGFAIPSTTVQAVMNDLITKGHVDRGWLGVSIQPMSADLAASMGTKPRSGVLLGDVMPGTPAAKAGLRPGDVVTTVNGQTVSDPGQLMSRIARLSPGAKAELKVLRDGSEENYSVTLGTRPSKGGAAEPNAAPAESNRLGLSVQPLDKNLREQFNLKADENGLAITDVESGSAAERAGLQPGDIILSVGGKEATSTEQFEELSAKATSDKGLLLRIKRGENARFAVIKPEK